MRKLWELRISGVKYQRSRSDQTSCMIHFNQKALGNYLCIEEAVIFYKSVIISAKTSCGIFSWKGDSTAGPVSNKKNVTFNQIIDKKRRDQTQTRDYDVIYQKPIKARHDTKVHSISI